MKVGASPGGSDVIGSLRGRLIDRSADGEVLVEVGGIGYRATVTASTMADLGDLGGDVFLWTHQHVREDVLTLYGFATRDERACFEALLGAHGVGPALALAILAVHSPVGLRRVLLDTPAHHVVLLGDRDDDVVRAVLVDGGD